MVKRNIASLFDFDRDEGIAERRVLRDEQLDVAEGLLGALPDMREDSVTPGNALCGDNVRIRLRGVDDEDISPGFVLTSPSNPIHAVRQFEAQLAILDHKNIICAGYSAVMHCHTLAEEVTLAVRIPRTRLVGS